MQPSALTPTRCSAFLEKSLICSLGAQIGDKGAVNVEMRRTSQYCQARIAGHHDERQAFQWMGKFGRANPTRRNRFRGRARHRRRAAGDNQNRDTDEPTEYHEERLSVADDAPQYEEVLHLQDHRRARRNLRGSLSVSQWRLILPCGSSPWISRDHANLRLLTRPAVPEVRLGQIGLRIGKRCKLLITWSIFPVYSPYEPKRQALFSFGYTQSVT